MTKQCSNRRRDVSDKFEEMFETYFGSLRKIKGSISFGAIATKKDILNFWQAAQANARADVEKAVLDERERIVEVLKQKYLKRSAITDLKSLHFAMAYDEMIGMIERETE